MWAIYVRFFRIQQPCVPQILHILNILNTAALQVGRHTGHRSLNHALIRRKKFREFSVANAEYPVLCDNRKIGIILPGRIQGLTDERQFYEALQGSFGIIFDLVVGFWPLWLPARPK